MSFTDGKPWVVTDKDVARRWGGSVSGTLQCNICGKALKAGETCRWQYAGDKGLCNFMVCEQCDGDTDGLLTLWASMNEQYERLRRCFGIEEGA